LDVVGLIPVVGEVADGANACISFGRGDYAGAALSAGAMIPLAGWGATAAKFGRKGAHLWTAKKKVSHVQNAFRHFKDHGAEFGANNAVDYVRRAHDFLNNSPAGTLTKTRPNGDVLKYHPSSNTFGVMDKCGQPRTMFKPDDGIDYWNRQ
jgi:pyocin large subunit-like protein